MQERQAASEKGGGVGCGGGGVASSWECAGRVGENLLLPGGCGGRWVLFSYLLPKSEYSGTFLSKMSVVQCPKEQLSKASCTTTCVELQGA